MGKEVDNKFTWVIKNFCSLQSTKIFSDEFVVGGCKWRLMAFPKGNGVEYLSLYLDFSGRESLPSAWRRHSLFHFTIVNQRSDEFSQTKETQHWFNEQEPDWGFTSMFPLSELYAKDGWFLVNGDVKIAVELDVLEVVGKLDVPEEPEKASNLLKMKKLNDDGAVSSDLHKEIPADWVDVNGFQVLPLQVELVNRLFERYPDIASKFRPKNPNLKTAYMNVLLSLTEILRQSPEKISKDDLIDAYAALGSVTDVGFKLDCLEKKLNEVSEKKEKEEACETRILKIEEELKDFKQKCSDLETLLEKEKAELLAARASLSYDDGF